MDILTIATLVTAAASAVLIGTGLLLSRRAEAQEPGWWPTPEQVAAEAAEQRANDELWGGRP